MKKVQSSGDDAELGLVFKVSEHGVSFSWACLSVGEYGWIFAHRKIVDVPCGNSVEEEVLGNEFAKNSVKTITVFAIVNHWIIVFVIVQHFEMRAQSAIYSHFRSLILFLVIGVLEFHLLLVLIAVNNLLEMVWILIALWFLVIWFLMITWMNEVLVFFRGEIIELMHLALSHLSGRLW